MATRIERFDTPGGLRDVPAGSPFYARWHGVVERLIATRTSISGTGRYVDPSKVAVEPIGRRTYTWTGFSRPLLVEHRDDRAAAFAAGDDRATQIEYLEWHVTRRGESITKVTFSTETPEYWKTLAEVDRDRVVELYRKLVDPTVADDELFPGGGDYDPLNRWNTTRGIVHYVMPINSMGDLLGVSQEVEPSGRALDGYDSLPYSRKTGADARLNHDMWAMSRAGLCVASADRPGLYIVDWDDSGWEAPDGSPTGDFWRVIRGTRNAALRVEYEVPATEGYTVGDIRIGGRPITAGGHLAEHVVMAAHGVAGRCLP